MANLKKLLVVVNFTGLQGADLTSAINQLRTKSESDYKDRVFFVENTHEIITHGQKYGVSDEIAKEVATLNTAYENLTGVLPANATSKTVDISDTSMIGKYVLAHTSDITAADTSVVVDHESDAAGTHYTVKVDTTAIVDGDTILAENGKLKSNLRFDFTHEDVVEGEKTVQHPFLVLKTADQEINGATKKGTVIDKFDVNEFVVDGMLSSVEYDDNKNALIFTWNTDSGKPQSTEINITDILKLEAVHSATEKYITVTPNKNPHDTEGAKGACYDVAAVVSNTDLTSVSGLAKADNDLYKSGVDTDAELRVALGKVANGLADAKTVATKFADADKKSADMANDIIGRLADLKKTLENKNDEQDAAIKQNAADIAANKEAIDLLNDADEDKAGSILNSLKKFRATLESDITAKADHDLVIVKTAIKNGALDADNSSVLVKTASLVTGVQNDAEYTVEIEHGKGGYKAVGIDVIGKTDPSLVTSQDAWVYGQCIKAQALKEIASDNNEYIHITREDNQTKIVFEPWAEVHSLDELATNLVY